MPRETTGYHRHTAVVEEREEMRSRFMGKVVRYDRTLVGVVTGILTQAEKHGEGCSTTRLTIDIQQTGSDQPANWWLRPDRIEVWGD